MPNRKDLNEWEPTVQISSRESYNGMTFIDVRPYYGRLDFPTLPIEIEMRSGNAHNDGLQMNTTLARITLEQARALRDRLAVLIGDEGVGRCYSKDPS